MKDSIKDIRGALYTDELCGPVTAWRDRNGVMWLPSTMNNHHLVSTIRMIWNHAMPPSLHWVRLEPFKRYKFSDFYSHDYMRACFFSLMVEAEKRTGLNMSEEVTLEYIKKVLQI